MELQSSPSDLVFSTAGTGGKRWWNLRGCVAAEQTSERIFKECDFKNDSRASQSFGFVSGASMIRESLSCN